MDMTRADTVIMKIASNTLVGRVITGECGVMSVAATKSTTSLITGSSPLELITSYTAYVGRLRSLPEWVGQGAVLGLQGGTAAVLSTLDRVERVWGNLSDVKGVWLQDWTGQRNFSGANDLPRVGLWWNWEVGVAGVWCMFYITQYCLRWMRVITLTGYSSSQP